MPAHIPCMYFSTLASQTSSPQHLRAFSGPQSFCLLKALVRSAGELPLPEQLSTNDCWVLI